MKKITRREALKSLPLFGLVLAAMMAARPSDAAAKVSKRAAGYISSPRGRQKCSNCRLFIPRNRTCQIVAGTFSPNGWCRFWR